MSVEMKWYGNAVQKLVDKCNYSGLTAAAITLENAIVKKIDSMDIIDTGRYKGSITYKTRLLKDNVKSPATPADGVQLNPKPFEAVIGTNVSYASYLEYGARGRAPRPAIRRAWDEVKNNLSNVFTLQFKKVFK
jgi:HK97 gp10 family phage protein